MSNDHTPDSCPLGERIMEQEENMRETLRMINDSLSQGHSTMGHLTKTLEATTQLATTTEKKLTGLLWAFRGAGVVIGFSIMLLCWVLLQKNDEIKALAIDIKSLAVVFNDTQKETAVERARRDGQLDAIMKELNRRGDIDSSLLAAIIEGYKEDKRSKGDKGDQGLRGLRGR